MARCPRCGSRKAKRSCPALAVEICPVCCAEGRLKTISCPSDCVHLGSEFYQHKRRREKAMSRGRGFIESIEKLFPDPAARDVAFKLHADIYFFLKRSETGASLADHDLAEALDSVRKGPSLIIVPGQGAHPLYDFLRERLEDNARYPAQPEAQAALRLRVVGTLADRARAGAAGSRQMLEEAASFFDALDFEADLDYSPDDARSGDPRPNDVPDAFPRRSAGGLILPAP